MSTPPPEPPEDAPEQAYVPVHPLQAEDPPRIGDFWLDARLTAMPSGVAFTGHDDGGHAVMVILLAEGAAADAAARDRLAGVVNRMHIDTVIARGGHGQDTGRLGRRYRSEDDDPVPPDERIVAPWVALAYDGSPAAAAEATRVLDEVQLASLGPQGSPSGPDYRHYWVEKVKPGLARLWPLPWPGRYDRAGWQTILVSWLLMLLLAALAVLIAILIFRNQPPQAPPPPTGGSGSPPPQSASASPQSGSPSGSQSGSPASPSARRRARSRARSPGPRRAPTPAHRPPASPRRRWRHPGWIRVAGRQLAGVPAVTGSADPAPPGSGRPGLIATDLDGTFLSPEGEVSGENAEAVLAAQAAGIPVVFATGRPVRWLDVIADLPGAHPTVIASNGAVLYDLGAGRALDRICIRPDLALEAVDRIRTAVGDASFAFESGTRFGYEASYTTWADDDGADPAVFSGPLEEISAGEDFVKVLVQSRDLPSDTLLAAVQDALGDILTATHSATRGYGLVEVSAPGVHKGAMLARVCERLGVAAADVAAFGDMPNDVGMLSWVGMPRIVANAHPALRELGYLTVGSNADSGVGRAIRQWLS